ncbi:calcium and integrin-binding protein 1-like [Oscarella lobularis]|uniref:calcium and integrin-binding protein 1-like n=1 Tax=Oscarella lobularis TaxID=121494 RepID=UPI0033131D91
MGSSCSRRSELNESELSDYTKVTFFTRGEVLHAFRRWKSLDPERIEANKRARLSLATIISCLDELSVNPLAKRMCQVFSSSEKGCGLNFEDFLDMMSVFSENAPKSLKIEYAFHIYDFNNDNLIDREDMGQLIDFLCGENAVLLDEELQLSRRDRNDIVDTILAEVDLDEDSSLNFAEFKIVMNTVPDFLNSFSIRL